MIHANKGASAPSGVCMKKWDDVRLKQAYEIVSASISFFDKAGAHDLAKKARKVKEEFEGLNQHCLIMYEQRKALISLLNPLII